MTNPAPLTPAESDLSGFKDMPLEVVRFAGSDLVTNEEPEAVVAALLLWCFSWHQRPAGSLPNNDKTLAKAAGYGKVVTAWQEVRQGALRGWIECSDGRLYHPVVAEKVRDAWMARLRQMHRNYGSAVRMWNSRHPDDQRQALQFEDWNEGGRPEGPSRERVAQQQALDLESGQMLRATEGDSYAQQPPDVARLKSTKGREGKGREGNLIEETPPTPSKPKPETDRWAKGGPPEISIDLCRIAGIPNIQPSAIERNEGVVREWLAAGVDFDKAAAYIRNWTRDNPDTPVRSLRYFDAGILKTVAVETAGGKRAKPAQAPKPIGIPDSNDPRIAKAREAIRAKLGARSYDGWLAPPHTAMKVNGVGLVIKTRSSFYADHVRSNFRDAIIAAIAPLEIAGCEIVE